MARTTSILAGVTLAAAVAAGGSAFTNSNTMPSTPTVGYGTNTVSGGTVSSLVYNTDAEGDGITSVALTLVGDTTGSDVSIAFNAAEAETCGVGTYGGVNTTYTCNDGGNFPQSTSGLTSTHVLINSTT